MSKDFEQVLDRTGLTRGELAKLYGVSRQAIYYWKDTALKRTNTYTARMAETITRALLVAIARGILPLPVMDRGQRRKKIVSMARTLQALKPAPVK